VCLAIARPRPVPPRSFAQRRERSVNGARQEHAEQGGRQADQEHGERDIGEEIALCLFHRGYRIGHACHARNPAGPYRIGDGERHVEQPSVDRLTQPCVAARDAWVRKNPP
jgi:hypothetical protein